MDSRMTPTQTLLPLQTVSCRYPLQIHKASEDTALTQPRLKSPELSLSMTSIQVHIKLLSADFVLLSMHHAEQLPGH